MKENKELTFKELKKRVESTKGKKVPGKRQLYESGSPVVMTRVMEDQSKITVFNSGFAILDTPAGSTVLRVDRCGGYTYYSQTQELGITEDEFDEMDWAVRLLIEGEDRLIHNQNAIGEYWMSAYGDDANDWGVTEDPTEGIVDMMAYSDLLKEVMEVLTPRQRLVVSMRYMEEYTLQQIADHLGISHQAVSTTLNDAKKKVQKNFNKYYF